MTKTKSHFEARLKETNFSDFLFDSVMMFCVCGVM